MNDVLVLEVVALHVLAMQRLAEAAAPQVGRSVDELMQDAFCGAYSDLRAMSPADLKQLLDATFDAAMVAKAAAEEEDLTPDYVGE